jgi:hypothetical protein
MGSERAIGGVTINLTLVLILAILLIVVFLLATAYILALIVVVVGFGFAYVAPGNKIATVTGAVLVIVGVILAITVVSGHGLALAAGLEI